MVKQLAIKYEDQGMEDIKLALLTEGEFQGQTVLVTSTNVGKGFVECFLQVPQGCAPKSVVVKIDKLIPVALEDF